MENPTMEISSANRETDVSDQSDHEVDPSNRKTDHLDHGTVNSEHGTPKIMASISEKLKEMSCVSNDIEAIVQHPIYGCVQKHPNMPELSWKNLEKAVKNRDSPGSHVSHSTSGESIVHHYAAALQNDSCEKQKTTGSKWNALMVEVRTKMENDDIDRAIWFWRLMSLILSVGLGVLIYETWTLVTESYIDHYSNSSPYELFHFIPDHDQYFRTLIFSVAEN